MAKKIEIDMERVYKLREEYKTLKEIAEIFTKEGVKISDMAICKKIKQNPYQNN